MNNSIQFKGIQRAIPQSQMPDGACHEIINLRPIKGAFRPVGEKLGAFNYSVDLSAFSRVFVHDIEGGLYSGYPNWIGLKVNGVKTELWLIDHVNQANSKLLHDDLDTSITVNVNFLKRTMLVTTGSGVLNFIWTGQGLTGNYTRLDILPVPDVEITTFDHLLQESEHFHDPDAILGALFKVLNTQSEETGRMFGSIMYIAAYKLFDGSFILHSMPKYLSIKNDGIIEQNNPGGGSQSDSTWWWEFYMSRIRASLKNQYSTTYTDDFIPVKDIVSSVCLFATKSTLLHQIDDVTFTEENLYNWFGTGQNNRSLSYMFPVSEEFKDLPKSTGWYKIHEFNFSDLVDRNDMNVVDLDTKGYYQDYATRETLTADQNTHHNNIARYSYVYNDRLHLLNIKTSFGSPYIMWDNPYSLSGESGTMPCKISVWLKTSLGQVIIQEDSAAKYYRINETNAFIVPSVVGYNDSRAYKMQILINTGANYMVLFEQTLLQNESLNFAYWTSTSFNAVAGTENANFNAKKVAISSLTSVATIPTPINSIFDTNRLQVSEIQNPLIFPAKNSYQIGTGDGLAMASGSEPLSSGQFGQFPLQVFTTKGIWTMEVGTGDILYPSIVPLAPEVINNAMNVIPSPFGVVYTTDKGLFMINGRQIAQLSEIIEDHNDTSMMDYVTENTEVQTLITDSKFTDSLTNSLSSVNFLDYIENSTVGYDHINKELIVTNYSHSYSYVYSFESQAWYKLSHSYRLLVNNYPYLYAVTSDNTVSISHESKAGYVDCLIITAAQSLQNSDNFKKIERLILRTIFTSESGNYPGFYVFGSNDLKTWQFLQGKQRTGEHVKDLLNQRSHGSAKYYVFIFAGKITTDSEIKQIDIVYRNKWDNRLR